MPDREQPIQIVWFKRDLRLEDHVALCEAAEAGPVLPLYILEPDYWALRDVSGRHFEFLRESVEALAGSLAARGASLVFRVGVAETVIGTLLDRFKGARLVSHEETGNAWTYARDLRVAQMCRDKAAPWLEIPQAGVTRRLKSRNGWARRWDKTMSQPIRGIPDLTPVLDVDRGPDWPQADHFKLPPDACPQRQRGGREAALATLESFLHERGEPYRKAMSAPEAGAKHCSRISPYLALGSLSMRETAQAGWHRQRTLPQSADARLWSGSMRSFMSRLHWRDHFIQKLEDEPELEWRNMHPGLEELRPQEADQAVLQAWSRGETGIPFIDACMRCLIATGWMNFRMRAMLTSFASYHLWQPWQASGQILARLFTDYEPGIHWSQIQMQSGTTGVNAIRIYNPVKQGHDQDPDGSFIRHWLPELSGVPDDFIHEVWRWPLAMQSLEGRYPRPVVDVQLAAKQARDRVFSARKTLGFKQASKAVLAKHGSRAPMRRKSRKTAPDSQLTLGL
ncbi:MAG: deoxyribodipyrimidine photo-lyase [Alphaproteobacteria bacterium]|nr:deoxyribodipyrimidine photo-lyase [Alphaproteobacteria bacterium]